jgi:hypothetical protein
MTRFHLSGGKAVDLRSGDTGMHFARDLQQNVPRKTARTADAVLLRAMSDRDSACVKKRHAVRLLIEIPLGAEAGAPSQQLCFYFFIRK